MGCMIVAIRTWIQIKLVRQVDTSSRADNNSNKHIACMFFVGSFLGPSWGRLGPSWGHLGDILDYLGAILGLLGVILGPSWGHLGQSWDHLGAILGLLGADPRERPT